MNLFQKFILASEKIIKSWFYLENVKISKIKYNYSESIQRFLRNKIQPRKTGVTAIVTIIIFKQIE